MNWKVFLTASVSSQLIAIPQNSFTCGGSEDPYDYYTSFFSSKTGTSEAYKPFYYTALLTFYDDWSQDSVGYSNDRVVQEWRDYTKATEADVVNLVYESAKEDVQRLKDAITNNQSLPSTFNNNGAAKTLFKEKKMEAASYLAFAKKVEHVSVSSDAWEEKKRDSLTLNKYINEAGAEFAKTTDAFIQTKWAFQRCKLSFYNNRYQDCIRWYDEFFTDANTASVTQLAMSYKGGSEFRLGKNKEAAYTFSKAFPLSDQNKRSNFLGFLWATDHCNQALIKDYTSLCKNNLEKANMVAMFGMYGVSYHLDVLKQVHQLNPSSPLLPLLATREINKLEEQYLTPLLDKEKGGKSLHGGGGWNYDESGNPKPLQPQPVVNAATFFETLSNDKNVPNRSLYAAGAAYLHFINKNYSKSKTLLTSGKDLNPDIRGKDQLSLINLLIVANEEKTITAEIETQMLPAVKWLTDKAKKDREYALFCRNFFSEILAQKYEQQNEAAKAALAYGMADLAFIKLPENEYIYSYPPAINFVRNEMTTADLLKLYETTTKPGTETEKFFVQNSSVKRDAVVDVIGTSYLRDRDYNKAIEWLGKAGKLEPLVETQYNYKTDKEISVYVDPLHDYLNDWQRLSKSSAKPYAKLTLAQKLLELQTKADGTTEDKSKIYYQLASGLYNMSYYGNSWNAVAYERSGSDWNEGKYDQPWKKEYYGVYKAREYYQKAYELATDKEFKAACLFMVAKCAQRQIPRPPYDYNNYEQYDKAYASFELKFKNNPLFAKFKTEFGTTKFYQYTYSRCSYLRDYVKKVSTPVKTTTKPKGKG
jgi:hypothetical protein